MICFNIAALMRLGNETKNVVSSRKQNSRPRRLSKLLRKKTLLKSKSNDKQHRNLPNTEDNGKTAFVSENTTSLDHAKNDLDHIENTAPESNDVTSNDSKGMKSNKRKPRVEKGSYLHDRTSNSISNKMFSVSCPSLPSTIPDENQLELNDATLIQLKTAVIVDNTIPASDKQDPGLTCFTR